MSKIKLMAFFLMASMVMIFTANCEAQTPTEVQKQTTDIFVTSKAPESFIDSLTMLYDSLIGESKQLIVVYNKKASSISSFLKAYELTDEGWQAVEGLDFPCNIGKHGFADYGKKTEGDGKSPTGIFTITHYFSKFPDFTAKMEKIEITKKTIWVDDPKDPMYNTYYEQDSKGHKKGEILYRSKDQLYDYVMLINHNPDCIPYKGSAIFMHLWSRPGGGTAGCVALEKQNILKLFAWMDSEKQPKILMGSLEKDAIFSIGKCLIE